VQAKEADWMWSYFNTEQHLENESTYGCLKSLTETSVKLLVKGALRQCLSKGLVDLQFDSISGANSLVKLWSITGEGKNIATGEENLPLLPDPIIVAQQLLQYYMHFLIAL
jgi:hypothetical protein